MATRADERLQDGTFIRGHLEKGCYSAATAVVDALFQKISIEFQYWFFELYGLYDLTILPPWMAFLLLK